jgi:arsenate reductase (thioredoxin)
MYPAARRRNGVPGRGGAFVRVDAAVTSRSPHRNMPVADNRRVSQGVELNETTRLHVEKAVDALVEEFGDVHSRDTVQRVMDDSLRQLVGDAQVDDFVPTLAHRFARERLKALGRAHGPESALPDVLFIGLGDTGRGQIAAALLTLRSEGGIVAHSAGSTAQSAIDPGVVEVMAELGVDLTEAYAKPLSREVLEAADVVVTMGRSVGSVELPDGTRHLDWRVGDPSGAPVDEIRRVRDDIDRRVEALVAELTGDQA